MDWRFFRESNGHVRAERIQAKAQNGKLQPSELIASPDGTDAKHPSQVILLWVEDDRHQQFIFRYLRRAGVAAIRAMRIVKSPSGEGSAEQWVREQFAIEVEAYRGRQAETRLIVLIDADAHTVRQRIRQLDRALEQADVAPINNRTEAIVRLVPKRNIETWILCLNGTAVNEKTDYKKPRDDWSDLIRTAIGTLYESTRPNAPVLQPCVESLRMGIEELRITPALESKVSKNLVLTSTKPEIRFCRELSSVGA